jgi:hypothetical protein
VDLFFERERERSRSGSKNRILFCKTNRSAWPR